MQSATARAALNRLTQPDVSGALRAVVDERYRPANRGYGLGRRPAAQRCDRPLLDAFQWRTLGLSWFDSGVGAR